MSEVRENWGSRAGFVLAAIGSAVGLGNLWGFPYKLYKTGGGAFLIPYIIAMLFIGIPLLISEFSLGHLTQRSTPAAFGRIRRKYATLGWWQILLSFVIITYYAVILAYCGSYWVESIRGIFSGGELPWAGVGVEGVKNAENYFYETYLNFSGGSALGEVQGHIVWALAITWVAMYLCIFRGVKIVSKLVLWTVPIPWLMLFILTVRGLTLEGSIQGLEYYLEPNFKQLADPQTWRYAFGQMFFSMSLAFGIMVTYSSFLHRKSDLNNNATIIGLADLGTSFIAGLAVFATLGGMAYATQQAGNPVPVDEVAKGGPGLAFVAFPYALAQLPHSAWFSAVFFTSLLLLGIDSAFSITECVLASIVDKTGWNRDWTLIGITGIGFGVGIIYCTKGGLGWLDKIDGFINGTWGIALTALFEALILGWLFRVSRLRAHANERSDWKLGVWWTFSMRVIIPIIMSALFVWSLFDEWKNPDYLRSADGTWQIQNIVGLGLMAIIPIISLGVAFWRFKGDEDELIRHEYSIEHPHGQKKGSVALVMGIVGFIAIAWGFVEMIMLHRGSCDVNWYSTVLISVGGGAAAVGFAIAGLTTAGYEAKTILTATVMRVAAALNIWVVGMAVGLGFALWTMIYKIEPGKTEYDGELSGTCYAILAVMFVIIFMGLGWCFYRAIKASSAAETEVQIAEM